MYDLGDLGWEERLGMPRQRCALGVCVGEAGGERQGKGSDLRVSEI